MRTGLFVGRFQPFHNGHLASARYSLEKVDRLVIVVGSAQKSHEWRNPFTAGERISMIKASLDAEEGFDWRRLLLIPVPDIDVHNLWVSYLDLFVPKYDVVFTNDPLTKLLFQERGKLVDEPALISRKDLSATEVRRRITSDESWQELVPEQVVDFIRQLDGEHRIKSLSNTGHMGH
ncbi:MAG: nicotinamide-nucleotide adenylyltransferase [Nitrososphaera sp.]